MKAATQSPEVLAAAATLAAAIEDAELARQFEFRVQRLDETAGQYQRELARWIGLYLQHGRDKARTQRVFDAPPVVRLRIYGSAYRSRPR